MHESWSLTNLLIGEHQKHQSMVSLGRKEGDEKEKYERGGVGSSPCCAVRPLTKISLLSCGVRQERKRGWVTRCNRFLRIATAPSLTVETGGMLRL